MYICKWRNEFVTLKNSSFKTQYNSEVFIVHKILCTKLWIRLKTHINTHISNFETCCLTALQKCRTNCVYECAIFFHLCHHWMTFFNIWNLGQSGREKMASLVILICNSWQLIRWNN